jgi:sarcosine oxidase
MKRRNFLQAAVAGIAAAASSAALGKSTNTPGKGALTADVVVFGAGSFGAWTAYQLRKGGMSVVLADAHGAGNTIGAAGGLSMVLASRTRGWRCGPRSCGAAMRKSGVSN